MKRIFLLLVAALSLVTASMAQNTSDISAVVNKINGMCPIPAGPGLTFTSIENTPDAIVFNYEINEQKMSVDAMKEQAEMLHDLYVSELLSTTNDDKQDIRAYSLSTGKPVNYHFSGTITDDTFTVTVLPAELK